MQKIEIFQYFLVFIASILVFSNSLYGAFCFDDSFALLYNGDVHNANNPIKDIFFHDFWGHDIRKPDSHKSYRPFTTISFRMNYLLFLAFGGNDTKPDYIGEDKNGSIWQPEAFLIGLHLVNVILHAITSCMVLKLSKDLFGSRRSIRGSTSQLATQAAKSSNLSVANGQNIAGNSKNTLDPQKTVENNQNNTFDTIPLLGALLFATHPVHVEAVASIVGRAEILSAVLCLAGFDFWRNQTGFKGTILALIFTYASVLCKEITFAMFGAFIVWDVLINMQSSIKMSAIDISTTQHLQVEKVDSYKTNNKKRDQNNMQNPVRAQTSVKPSSKYLPKWLPAWTSLFVQSTLLSLKFWIRSASVLFCIGSYLYLRSRLMGDSIVVQNYRRVENPLAFIPDFLGRWLSIFWLHANYLWVLIYPVYLSCDWSYNCIPLINSIWDIKNVYSLASYLAVIIPSILSLFLLFKARIQAMPILFLIFTGILMFLPASNFFFYVGTMLAERVMYLPSVSFCVLLPVFANFTFQFIPKKVRYLIISAFFMALIAFYSQRTYDRNKAWIDNEKLFESAEVVCENSAKVHFNLGILRTQQRNYTAAMNHFKRCIDIEPNYCEVNYRRALMYLAMNQYQLAVLDLHQALDCVYTRAEAATTLHKVYQAMMQADPKNAETYINLWNLVKKKLQPLIDQEKEASKKY